MFLSPMYKGLLASFLLCLVFAFPYKGFAQTSAAPSPLPALPSVGDVQAVTPAVPTGGAPLVKDTKPLSSMDNPVVFGPPKPVAFPAYNPILFTYAEYLAIEEARHTRAFVRAPTQDELLHDFQAEEAQSEKVKPPPEKRFIFLSGIVYKPGKKWTIYLNGQRVTPDALPKEIMDLKVYKTYVEMKWYDDYTNQIFPIRLRPHQRFNIDARVFLPG